LLILHSANGSTPFAKLIWPDVKIQKTNKLSKSRIKAKRLINKPSDRDI